MSDYRQKHERRPVSRQTKLMDVLWKAASPWRNIFSGLRPRQCLGGEIKDLKILLLLPLPTLSILLTLLTCLEVKSGETGTKIKR